jgi:hypothetical protein
MPPQGSPSAPPKRRTRALVDELVEGDHDHRRSGGRSPFPFLRLGYRPSERPQVNPASRFLSS